VNLLKRKPLSPRGRSIASFNREEELRDNEDQWAHKLNTLRPYWLNDNDVFFVQNRRSGGLATSRPFLKPRLSYLPRAKREGNLRVTKSRG